MESTQLQTLSILLLLSLISSASSVRVSSIAGAVKSLSNSGFNSMALTLEFGHRTLLPTNTLTIFAPPDTAFKNSGQPPLSLLHLHFSPLSLSLRSLKALPVGSKIPTFFSNHSLLITSSSQQAGVALNGVKINGSALFDDGSLVVFGTEDFFHLHFDNGSKDDGFSCGGGGVRQVAGEASGALKINGFSIIAAFLDLQVGEFNNNTPITVFAPPDTALKASVGNFTRFRSMFLRHLVPCRISGSDLENLGGGIMFPTFLQGFSLDFIKSGSEFRIEGVNVTIIDMYRNDWMVVHGIQRSFVVEDRSRDSGNIPISSSEKITVAQLLYGTMAFAAVVFWYFFTLTLVE